MTKYALTDNTVGNLGPSDFFQADTTQRFPLGSMVTGVDVSGIFGFGEFIYLQANGTITPNQICTYADGYLATAAAQAASSGKAYVVSKDDMVAGQFGWFQKAGAMIPLRASASVAAGGAVGTSATAGSVAASAATFGLPGTTSLRASTATRVTTANTKSGSKTLQVRSSAGLFRGQAASGTGIAGGSIIVDFDNDDNPILNNAATATGSASITFTNTGFIEASAPNGLIQTNQ